MTTGYLQIYFLLKINTIVSFQTQIYLRLFMGLFLSAYPFRAPHLINFDIRVISITFERRQREGKMYRNHKLLTTYFLMA